jgi:Uma2 family endonuclease
VVKAALYARFGVRFYWVVDPDAPAFEEYERAGQGYRQVQVVGGPARVTTVMFPGLVVDLAQVWA